MTFEKDDKKTKIATEADKIQEKWNFLTDFIFNTKKKEFRNACYAVNKNLWVLKVNI